MARAKNILGADTASVLQELADSQITRLKDSNVQLQVGYKGAQAEVQRCHDQIARQAAVNHNL